MRELDDLRIKSMNVTKAIHLNSVCVCVAFEPDKKKLFTGKFMST